MPTPPAHRVPYTHTPTPSPFAVCTPSQYYKIFADKLEKRGTGYFTSKLSCADISFYSVVKIMRAGQFDHVPKDADAKYPVIQVRPGSASL